MVERLQMAVIGLVEIDETAHGFRRVHRRELRNLFRRSTKAGARQQVRGLLRLPVLCCNRRKIASPGIGRR